MCTKKLEKCYKCCKMKFCLAHPLKCLLHKLNFYSKIQVEHSHRIIDPIVTQKKIL